MCDVATAMLVMGGLAAGTSALQINSQNKAAYAAADSASNAATADYAAVSDAADQVNVQANAEALKLRREALVERGRLVAAQSETGFIGNSPLVELNNQRLKEQEALGTVDYNRGNALMQNSRDMSKIFAAATGRYNEAKSTRVNPFAAGLMIATSGVQGAGTGYTLYEGMTKPKGTR
jgi:hypothetical protein